MQPYCFGVRFKNGGAGLHHAVPAPTRTRLPAAQAIRVCLGPAELAQLHGSGPVFQFLHVVVLLFLLLGCMMREKPFRGLHVVLPTRLGWTPGLGHTVSAFRGLQAQT